MSTHFHPFTSSHLDSHADVPGVGLSPVKFPFEESPPVATPCEPRALVPPESDNDDDAKDAEWDEFEPGPETDWDWVDDADLFDDLFDDAEPLEDVDWADRLSEEDDEDQ